MKKRNLRIGRCTLASLAFLFVGGLHGNTADEFFSQSGRDPTFAEVMASGDLPRGKNSTTGVTGSRIRVESKLLESGPNAKRAIPKAIKIHTLGSSVIPRSAFPRWSRWYQEDGNTQIFRLFKGEENVRNSRALAARVEAFSELNWQRGAWHEWVGTYTIIKPHGCAIFQAKNNDNDWSVQLNMNSNGDILLNHRRAKDKVIARNMVGKPFHIRVRDNGHEYEVYLNGKKQGEGVYARPSGKTSFRWGMYLGANEVKHDAMILVTGAGIDPKDYDPALAMEAEESPPEPQIPEPEAPVEEEGLRIPERVWTNKDGKTMKATALYQPGDESVKLRIDNQWVTYQIEDLAEDDRAALRQALDFMEE
jgi:hypothetical protein